MRLRRVLAVTAAALTLLACAATGSAVADDDDAALAASTAKQCTAVPFLHLQVPLVSTGGNVNC